MNISRFSVFLVLVALLLALPTVVQGQQGCSIGANDFEFEYKAGIEYTIPFSLTIGSSSTCQSAGDIVLLDLPSYFEYDPSTYAFSRQTIPADSIGSSFSLQYVVYSPTGVVQDTAWIELTNINVPNTLSAAFASFSWTKDEGFSPFNQPISSGWVTDSDYDPVVISDVEVLGDLVSWIAYNGGASLTISRPGNVSPNFNGTLTDTLRILAPDGEHADAPITLNINPIPDVNVAETLTVNFEEDQAGTTEAIVLLPISNDYETLNWTMMNVPDELVGIVSMDASTGAIAFDGSPNLCGQWTLEASVEATNDYGSASDDFMVDLTIECVNDAPTWNHFEISECEGTSQTYSFDDLDGWGWFVDDSDEGFGGNGVTPGIDWVTLSTSDIPFEIGDDSVTFQWPENNLFCCDSLQTQWSFQVADSNGVQVTGPLYANILPFDSAPDTTQVAMGQTIHDGDTTTITIAWSDVDNTEVLLDVTNQTAGVAVVPPADPIFNSPIDLKVVVDSLVCGEQSISFQLLSNCDSVCSCGAETPDTTTLYFTVTLKDDDNDGIPDHYPGEIVALNSDSDNDGIPDKAEQQWPDNATLACTTWTLVDSDDDGTPDFLDEDSDNDNIPDAVEGGAFYDNGWLAADADMDGDGLRNHLDEDSDGDGILDTLEWGVEGYQNSDDLNDPDTTAAGTPLYDFLDTDSDNDSLPDSLEDENQNGEWEFPESNARHPDSDGDGTDDNLEAASIEASWLGEAATSYPRVDWDSDDDGLPDALERDSSWLPYNPDTDGDSLLNPYDPDTDGDCLLDGLEIGLVSSSVVFDQAGETFKRTSSSFELLCSSCGDLPTNRFDADAGATVTNPGSADTDGDGYADGFEDANLNGQVDCAPGSGPLGGTSAPCPTCFSNDAIFSNDTIFCLDCATGPHAGVVECEFVESDPTQDCSPNCLVGTGCDCDGDLDESNAAQENFCSDLWQELCEATADVSLDEGELDSLIWSLLVPNPDSCSYFTVDSASFDAKSYLVYYNATNDTDTLSAKDFDAYPNACDNCNPGYHLGYKSGGEPCPACSYVGGSILQTFNNQADGPDDDSIGNLCDDCDDVAGGIKGCTDWHACNYDPFAACDASTSLCTYTLPDLNTTALTLSVCADTDEFDLLGALYNYLDDSVPNWRSDQKFDLFIGNYEEQDVQATANLYISIPEVLESNNASCGILEVQLKLKTENDFSAWAEYAGFVQDSLLLAVPQYGRFNETGSDEKIITFFLQIDPAPEPSGASTSLCAGFVAEIQLDNPFEPLPCATDSSYQWTDVPAGWSISNDSLGQPTLTVPDTVSVGNPQNLQVEITVGTCTATASYAIEAAEQSSISLTSAEDFQVADQTYQVNFCANTLDTLLFGVEAVGGNWQPGIDTTEVWTTTENDSFFISSNESTYSIDLPNLPVDATSHSNTLTIYLQENPNCNADSVTVTFNKRAAPAIAWSEDLGDMLDICETAALDSISFHANSGDTGFGWNHPSSGLTQQASGEDNDQIWLPLGLDTLAYDDHVFTESLRLEILAEESIFLGCAAVRDTLMVRVFEAPSVPEGANDFFRNPICAPFNDTIVDALTPVSDSIGSVWNDAQFGIDWIPSICEWCLLETGNVFTADSINGGSTRIEAYLKWENDPTSTSDWRCANVYDTLVIRIGESPDADTIDWYLFSGGVDSHINVGDATCNGTEINFSLMPTDLDNPSSPAAEVGYRWWVNNNQMSDDTTFTYNVEVTADIKAAAIWTYTIDDVVFSCASDTISETIEVAPDTACTSNTIIAYPGPAFLATALSNQNPVPNNYWVNWGYFSTESDGTTVTGAHFFQGAPAQGAALFYPTQAQVDSVLNATSDNAQIENLDQYIFALISFYGADMKCPCLSLADGSVADGVVATGIEEWIDLEEVGFLVYPNPTTGRVFVEPPGGEPASEPLEAKIYNMTGREVFRTGLASYGSQILDISHLQNGIYVLRITSPTEVRHLQTLILTQY